MKQKKLHLMILTAIMISQLFLGSTAKSQTAGTLTCSYTTVSSGGYSPNNCLACWIERADGTFIKTKVKASKSSNFDHLATWTSQPSYNNYVDAVSGNTRTNGLLTITWNGTDLSTNIVTDGTYKVWVEFAWASSLTTGKTVQSFSFTKGPAADHQTPANMTNFTGITLDWVPLGVGIDENSDQQNFSISPNPVNASSTINYSLLHTEDVTISLYDINGKLVKVLCDQNQTAGNYSLPLSANTKPGVYFVKIYTGRTQHTERILIAE